MAFNAVPIDVLGHASLASGATDTSTAVFPPEAIGNTVAFSVYNGSGQPLEIVLEIETQPNTSETTAALRVLNNAQVDFPLNVINIISDKNVGSGARTAAPIFRVWRNNT